MQQDNNHIENKLRQLENQQLPDLSAMDVHWKEMKNLVQSYLPKAKPLIPKNIFWMIGAACLVGVVLLILNWGTEKQNQLIFAGDANTKQKKEILSDTLLQALLKNDSVKQANM
jgi:hypothetical protein